MEHAIYRVVDFKKISTYILMVKFDDGKEIEIDFRPVLNGELYAPLLDERIFNQFEIDPEIHTLVWPNGADFDPETLHDWPKYIDEIIKISEKSEPAKSQAL